MNAQSQHSPQVAHIGLNYTQGEACPPLVWGPPLSSANYCLMYGRFALTITNITLTQLGLDLNVLITHPNGELLYYPSSYSDIFMRVLNSSEQKISYEAQRDSPEVRMSMVMDRVGGELKDVRSKCQGILKGEEPILEKALEVIGLIRPKGKISLLLKKAQINLKKKVISAIKAPTPAEALAPSAPNSSIFRVKQIRELPNLCQEDEKPKRGGYFQVVKSRCEIVDNMGNTFIEDLACKSQRKNKKMLVSAASKISKEVLLASRLVDSTHSATYYLASGEKEKLFMEYIPDLLKEYVYRKKLSLEELVDLSKQLIRGVEILHQSGIVHRDLKPENILIQNKDGKPTLKIIDFGESTLSSESFNKKVPLGCTLPYSPIECISGHESGFNKPAIDLWSVAMILYEMAFQNTPMFYARCLGPEILEKSKRDGSFSIFPIYRKKRGARAVEEVISLMSISGLQLNQGQRLRLESMRGIFQSIQEFLNMV